LKKLSQHKFICLQLSLVYEEGFSQAVTTQSTVIKTQFEVNLHVTIGQTTNQTNYFEKVLLCTAHLRQLMITSFKR
jgi:hypothetical protein